jgi:hypothetical protein
LDLDRDEYPAFLAGAGRNAHQIIKRTPTLFSIADDLGQFPVEKRMAWRLGSSV